MLFLTSLRPVLMLPATVGSTFSLDADPVEMPVMNSKHERYSPGVLNSTSRCGPERRRLPHARAIAKFFLNDPIETTSRTVTQRRNVRAVGYGIGPQSLSGCFVVFHDAESVALSILAVKHVSEFRQRDLWCKNFPSRFRNLSCKSVNGTHVKCIDG